jgi:hypothetical protein
MICSSPTASDDWRIASRDGNWKYLCIAGNQFLFDEIQDPRERANLKDRDKDVFDRPKADWEAWNRCWHGADQKRRRSNGVSLLGA